MKINRLKKRGKVLLHSSSGSGQLNVLSSTKNILITNHNTSNV